MSEQKTCPTCGCVIGLNAQEKEGVFYCCAPCAAGQPCECGCCPDKEQPSRSA